MTFSQTRFHEKQKMNIFRLCFVSLVNLNKILVRRHIYPSALIPMLTERSKIQCRKHIDVEPTNNSNQNPPNPNKLSEVKKEPFETFYTIIKAGDSKHLRDKLSEGLISDINAIHKIKEDEYTLLMKAAEEGQTECVKVLLEFGA